VNASLNNAGLELVAEAPAGLPSGPADVPSATETLCHEALQALLAFSALHQQIRLRRTRQMRDGVRTQDDWRLEQFVLDEVLELVAQRALTITGADGIAIALAEGDAIVCRASAGTIAPDAGVKLDPNSGFSGECLVSGQIVRCDDVDADSRVDLAACRRLGVRSMLAVPFSAKHTVIGLLEGFSSEPYGFNDSDVRSLNLLAELILSALRPEEEDRLSEISARVVRPAVVESVPIAVTTPEVTKPVIEPPTETVVEKHESDVVVREAVENSPQIEKNDSISAQSSNSNNNPVHIPELELSRNSRPGLAVVVAVVFFAVGLGGGLWWTLGHRVHLSKAVSTGVATPSSTSAPTVPPAPASLAPAATSEDEGDTAPLTSEEAGVLPQVTAIRHWSSGDSSTVVIDIQDQIQYEAHRLANPDRIYFDLHDTTLNAELSNRIISVNDAQLQRVRVAQPLAGVTRVVLETKGSSDFSVSLEPNPYRLVVEVRKFGSKPQSRAKVDLFTPANPATEQATTLPPRADRVAITEKPLVPQESGKDQKTSVSAPKALDATGAQATVSTPRLRVVLDPGHGGWDLGTVGRKGLLEKDLVLDIVQRLGQLVESRLGAEVIFTRKDDSYLALEKRAEIANLSQARLFVSIHANYSDYPSARGVETYYTNTYSSVKARTEETDQATAAGLQPVNWTNVDIREKVHESRRVAASVQRSLYKMLAASNPGLPNRGVKEAHYVVLTGTSMPAILAEVSFVSSPTDENNLQRSTYRQQIAEALYEGIAHYEASTRDTKLASAGTKTAAR
jgi:N-acetylmuramoyl-L-alanine amidase